MHIGILSDPASFHTQKWANGLKNAGLDVSVFSFSDAEIPGIHCVKVDPMASLNGKITYGSYLYSGARLMTALRQHKIDLINPINVTPFSVWGYKSGFRPMVSIAMGADVLEYPPREAELGFDRRRIWNNNDFGQHSILNKWQYQLKWRIFRRYVSQALQHSDLITGDNLELVRAVRDWFQIPESRIKLNRWGIEEPLFFCSQEEQQALRKKYQIRDWQKVILSPRGLKPVYQGDLILKAFEMLLRRGVRDIKFILFSAGYDIPPDWAKKAKDLDGQFENFTFVADRIPREEVLKLWSLVDGFISAPVYDGYSNALGEGRFAGAIPIVNAIPANQELIIHNENGWIVDPFTPHHLADAILMLMEQADFYQTKFATVNRDWVKRYGLLEKNMRVFVKDCRQLVHHYRRKKSHLKVGV